jgi:hypothetical protein
MAQERTLRHQSLLWNIGDVDDILVVITLFSDLSVDFDRFSAASKGRIGGKGLPELL